MNHPTTDLLEALAQKLDIKEVFRRHLETAVNQLLKHELTVFLDYEPYDRDGVNSGNSRNGFYGRIFKTEYGNLELHIPRDICHLIYLLEELEGKYLDHVQVQSWLYTSH
ncbi:Transposase, Mutator family [Lentibacillus halodurans]|uniref:Transposase, Mutator family n=1 Tax=Lentibacillus halodurans TaxID=237679 RepID=A0A1I1AE44_9BACI|nr:Transposase, Mutator family [Lentibacillus halodurans]